MPATLEQALAALAAQCTITQDDFAGGTEFGISAPGGERGLMVEEIIERLVTTVENAPVDLGVLLKHIRFDDFDPANPTRIGGMPVSEPVPPGSTPLLTQLLEGGLAAGDPGVPGFVGTITGAIPVPVQNTNVQSLTHLVSVMARWRITTQSGATASDVEWNLGGQSGEGGDIPVTSNGLGEKLQVVLGSLFAELTAPPPGPVGRRVGVDIQLIAGGVATGWISLPPIPMSVPAIPVPTIAVFARHRSFNGTKLIVVPGNSPLDKDSLAAALDTLNQALAAAGGALGAASLFVSELSTLRDIVSSGTVRFRKTDRIANLNNIDLESGFFNDTEAEDELSSMLLIGAPGRLIRCYNDRGFKSGQGVMEAIAGDALFMRVDDLHSASPVSEPPGRVNVTRTPDGSRRWFHSIKSFGDEFSSLEFDWA